MNNKTKMTMVMAAAAVMCMGTCFARGHHGGPRGGYGPRVSHGPSHHHHHHYSTWGRGGRNFWPGFVGGFVGGMVSEAIVRPAPVVVSPAPVVVQQPVVVSQPVVAAPVVATPVYTTQSVWVEGRYIDQVQSNGTILRVWQPGHYEQRQVLVQ